MKQFKIKSGACTIPVFFVEDSIMNKAGKDLVKEGQFLYGMFLPKKPKILLNKDCDDQFGTFIHEVGEFALNRYGVRPTHEQLSVVTSVISEILERNWNKIESVFNLSDKMPRKDNGQGTRLTARAPKKPKVKRSR